jgi:hypothetical protein
MAHTPICFEDNYAILLSCIAICVENNSLYRFAFSRCFVAVFNPFLMGGLLMVKIIIPFLLTAIFFSQIIQVNIVINVQYRCTALLIS